MNHSSAKILDKSINTTDDKDILTSFDHIITNVNLATFSAHYGFNGSDHVRQDARKFGETVYQKLPHQIDEYQDGRQN